MIHGGRGYNDDQFLCFCSKIDASVFFTVKRSPTLPFSFGSTYYKHIQEQQVIPENGCQTAFMASRDIDGRKLHLTAYRNGTVHVVLFASSNPSFAGNRWSLILQKQSDRIRYLSQNYNMERNSPTI
jgi:hypothetical protein